MLFSCFSCYQHVVSRCVLWQLWSEIQREIQLEPLFTIHALDIWVHAVPVTKLKIFTLLLVKQRLFNFWAYNYVATGIFQTKCEYQKLSVEIYSVFVAFVISHDPSACTSVEHTNLWKMAEPLLFCWLPQTKKVEKRQYLKICSLECDKIWQNSCHYITLQSLKTLNLKLNR